MDRLRTHTAPAAITAAVLLVACQGQPLEEFPGGEGGAVGAAAGAAAAQVLSDEVGTLGTVLAAAAGGLIGAEITENENVEESLAQNQPVTLTTDAGREVVIEPVRTFQREGQTCREFIVRPVDATAAVDQRRAVACQEGPQQWRLASAY